jgi:hypothetical protein
MFRKLALKSSVWHKPDIAFEWDPDARQVRGADAQLVLEHVLDAVKAGAVTSHPYPTTYPVTNPLSEPREMAAVLGQYWILPEWLAAALPQPEPEDVIEPTQNPDLKFQVQILH